MLTEVKWMGRLTAAGANFGLYLLTKAYNEEEEVFAFARCCSRLVQMGSKEWAETAGIR